MTGKIQGFLHQRHEWTPVEGRIKWWNTLFAHMCGQQTFLLLNLTGNCDGLISFWKPQRGGEMRESLKHIGS